MMEKVVIESKLRFLKEYLVDLSEYETISLNAYQTKKKRPTVCGTDPSPGLRVLSGYIGPYRFPNEFSRTP